jgi:hypothetical protein
MKPRLTKFADVIIALSCLTVAGLLVEQRFFRTETKPASAQQQAGPSLVGRRLPEIAGVSFNQSPHTLLIVMRSTCKFCDASAPFWQRLIESRQGSVQNLRVVAISDESAEISHEYLRRHGLTVDSVVSGKVPTPGTPTLLLVDSQGVVKESWIGKPVDKGVEDTIIQAVRSKSTGPAPRAS